MLVKYINKRFFLILSVVWSIIILFPPVYPSSYIFLFSNSYFIIRLEVLALELFLGILFSYLLYLIFFNSSINLKFFLFTIFFSSFISYTIFLLSNSFLSLFSPSFADTAKMEAMLYNKYADIINDEDVKPYIASDSYYTPIYLYSKYLFEFFSDLDNNTAASIKIYNSIDLPISLLPPLEKYLIHIDKDDKSRQAWATERPKYLAEHKDEPLLGMIGLIDRYYNRSKDNFIELPIQYRSYYNIPSGYRVFDSDLSNDIENIKYSYVQSNFKDLFTFYKAKKNIYLSVTAFYSDIMILRYIISTLTFLSILIFVFLKRKYFLNYFNSLIK